MCGAFHLAGFVMARRRTRLNAFKTKPASLRMNSREE
jgi:hypothetical protein